MPLPEPRIGIKRTVASGISAEIEVDEDGQLIELEDE
jgi:hypothetical protein